MPVTRILAMLLLALASQSTIAQVTQSPTTNAVSNKTSPSKTPSDQTKFVLSGDGKEYHSEQLITPSDTVGITDKIQVQVGRINGKPAYQAIVVKPTNAPKNSKEVDELLRTSPVMAAAQSDMQQLCTGEKVCVETKKLNGHDVCVKWRCK